MKNPHDPRTDTVSRVKYADSQLVPIPGMAGYYVDHMNRVVSFRSKRGRYVKTSIQRRKGAKYECLQLYDDEGVRRFVSRKTTLITALGAEEYRRREHNRQKEPLGELF